MINPETWWSHAELDAEDAQYQDDLDACGCEDGACGGTGYAVIDTPNAASEVVFASDGKITAAACRKACGDSGFPVPQCRAMCQHLSGASCCGLKALWAHFLRHRQKRNAELAFASCQILCGPVYCVQ